VILVYKRDGLVEDVLGNERILVLAEIPGPQDPLWRSASMPPANAFKLP